MDKPLQQQCTDGDLILISQICEYKTKWKGNRKNLTYYSNTVWRNLYILIMNEYVIPLSDFYKYKLRTKGQFIFLEALIPFGGISDEIEVAEIHGSSFKGIQS